MNVIPKSAWRYALLMLLLLGAVALASYSIIEYLQNHIGEWTDREAVRELSMAIWAMTMGVMFLTGAFGLWGIRSTVEIEGRRRIGRFVAAMDYLSDGLMLLDGAGRIIGYNPALVELLPRQIRDLKRLRLTEAFHCLSQADLVCLLDLTTPRELERNCFYDGALHTLRFRSQPSSGVRLVLVSDVTDMRSHEMRLRQIALLQLVGRIAGGVAHDFNNILCSISAYADLLARDFPPGNAGRESLAVIQKQTQKGAALSRQLLALSRAGGSGALGARIEKHLHDAADLLRVALTPAWQMQVAAAGEFPRTPLTAGQIEQIVLNLGLLAADAQPHPGILTITLHRRGEGNLAHVPDRFETVLLITAEPAPAGGAAPARPDAAGVSSRAAPEDGGVILSVVKSLVEEAQGALDELQSASGICIYRVCLPHLALPEAASEADLPVPAEFSDYLRGWRITAAVTGKHEPAGLFQSLREAGVAIERRDNFMAVLGGVDSLQTQDAFIVDFQMLENEAGGLIKALLKLCPRLGVVILCPDPAQPLTEQLKSQAVFAGYAEPPGRIMQALITAKALRTASHNRG